MNTVVLDSCLFQGNLGPSEMNIMTQGVLRATSSGRWIFAKEKTKPTKLGPKEFDDLGKTTGLLLRLTKPVWSTGKVFVLDSGFCVLKAIVELRNKGLFAASLIKKRRYWPKYIPGDDIIQHFVDKEVGHCDALVGKMNGVPFHVHAMKELDYVMVLQNLKHV